MNKFINEGLEGIRLLREEKTSPKQDAKIQKYHLNLAGEYRVCSELLKRGVFATITLGNMKGCDIVAVGENERSAKIEVKTSQSTRFVTGFYQKYKTSDTPHPRFWVLHSIIKAGAEFQERFFILTHKELAKVQAERNYPGQKLTYIESAKRVEKGVDNVLLKDLHSYEDKWDKIVNWCMFATSNSGNI